MMVTQRIQKSGLETCDPDSEPSHPHPDIQQA